MTGYSPGAFPFKSLSMLGLQSWVSAELAAVSAAMPDKLVISAMDRAFNIKFNSDQDQTPAMEDWEKKAPDGSLTIFPAGSYLTIKQEWVWPPSRKKHIGAFQLPVPGWTGGAPQIRWAGSSNGGRAIYLRSCDHPGFHNIHFIGEGEDVFLESDETNLPHGTRPTERVTGTHPVLRSCYFDCRTGNRPGHRCVYVSRTARQNQEFAECVDTEFYGDGTAPLVGGRYDSTDAANLARGSDIIIVNGAFGGPGNDPTTFSSAHVGWDFFAATGPDGRTLFHTSIVEILGPLSVRLASPAPSDETAAYFAMANARGTAVTIGANPNAHKEIFKRCTFQRFWCAQEFLGGSFHNTRNNYSFNTCDIAIADGGPSADEYPTMEHSLQHLRHRGWSTFTLRGPGRMALSRPMPATPFMAFGDNSAVMRMEDFIFTDRPPLPKGSRLFDLTSGYSWNNQPTGPTPAQLLLMGNTYSNYTRRELGVDRAAGSARIRRMMESDGEGFVFDQTIDATGITGA